MSSSSSGGEPGNRAMANAVAAGDLAQWLAVLVAAADRLALLVFGQFRFASQLDATRRIEGPSARSPQHRVNREHPNQNAERLVLVSNSGEQALLDRYRHRPCVSVTSSLALSIWAALIPAACWRWQS
jgi:hypothetical protein